MSNFLEKSYQDPRYAPVRGHSKGCTMRKESGPHLGGGDPPDGPSLTLGVGRGLERGAVDTIRVGAHTYQLLSDAAAKIILLGNGNRGETDAVALTIRVDPDMPSSAYAETLLHETLHAVWHQAGLQRLEVDEEDLITALAPTLLAVLRDNPALVATLTGD